MRQLKTPSLSSQIDEYLCMNTFPINYINSSFDGLIQNENMCTLCSVWTETTIPARRALYKIG